MWFVGVLGVKLELGMHMRHLVGIRCTSIFIQVEAKCSSIRMKRASASVKVIYQVPAFRSYLIHDVSDP